MRKLVFILIAFIAVITFIRAYDHLAVNYSGIFSNGIFTDGIDADGIYADVISTDGIDSEVIRIVEE